MDFKNVKVPKVPGGGAASTMAKLALFAGVGVYGLANSIYNVDGGHRAIVFNRISGIKDKVRKLIFLCFLVINSILEDPMVYYIYFRSIKGRYFVFLVIDKLLKVPVVHFIYV